MAGGKRPRSENGEFLALTEAQHDALFKLLSKAEGTISWTTLQETRPFKNIDYNTLRNEGKSIQRRLKKKNQERATSSDTSLE